MSISSRSSRVLLGVTGAELGKEVLIDLKQQVRCVVPELGSGQASPVLAWAVWRFPNCLSDERRSC